MQHKQQIRQIELLIRDRWPKRTEKEFSVLVPAVEGKLGRQ